MEIDPRPGLSASVMLTSTRVTFTAVADIIAEERGIARVEPEAETVRRFQTIQVQISEASRHLAGVVEDGPSEGIEYSPAVLRVDQQQVPMCHGDSRRRVGRDA